MGERIAANDNIQLWTEYFGNADHEPVLLIMGATEQGMWWHEGIIQKLVTRDRFVIRYDHRDTGQSTMVDISKDPYTLEDLAADAFAVLDAYGIESAHVMGKSMGGMIIQVMAIKRPERLRSATIVMSTPLGGYGSESDLSAEQLPGPAPQILAATQELQSYPTTREGQIDQRVREFELAGGPVEPFDEAFARKLASIEIDRANSFPNRLNHFAVFMTLGDRRPMLASVKVPTLIAHGTEDPSLPYAHGQALAAAFPNATLFTMNGAGHGLILDRFLDGLIDRMIALAS